MKTEVKFRELPGKVQEFVERTRASDKELVGSDDVRLYWLHNLKEWNQATNEERLAYAEWRYPVGTKYNNAHPNDKTGVFILEKRCYKVNYLGEENSIGTNGQGWILWKNKWAEIILTPDEVKEPKAGDMVEASDYIDFPVKETGKDFVWTGGKCLEGKFICQRAGHPDGGLYRFKYIRLPQKSEVESKAKELMENHRSHEFTGVWYYTSDTVEVIIEQAIKWGQANPDKI